MIVTMRAASFGSSPLARGLHWTSCHDQDCSGIIPARAGFTGPQALQASATADHPRSRGVYSLLLQGGDLAGGIIPARAGFTSPCSFVPTGARDHPRSRGVYSLPEIVTVPVVGSSPLARGLPPSHLAVCVSGRIIPARAGFTQEPGEEFPGWQDHPRSRGVYEPLKLSYSSGMGSSPLARGLRFFTAILSGAGRIIPARAGFT